MTFGFLQSLDPESSFYYKTMDQTKYSTGRNLKVHGFFVSRVKVFGAPVFFLTLVIALLLLVALIARQKGEEKYAQIKGDAARLGK